MNELQITNNSTAVAMSHAPSQTITADLHSRFISFLDAKPKTVKTYTRALRQFFNYLYSTGITKPKREDVIAFRKDIKTKGHKPTTVQSYITAIRLFFGWTAQERLYPNVAEHVKGARIDRDHKKDYLTAH